MKKIKKSIICLVLLTVMVFGTAISGYADFIEGDPADAYISIIDVNTGEYLSSYALCDNQPVAFVAKAGQGVVVDFNKFYTKLLCDGQDLTPSNAQFKQWKKDSPGSEEWWYYFGEMINDVSVSAVYNAKKNKVTIASCDTASAATTNNDALQQYYEALEKQNKKNDTSKTTTQKAEPTQEELLAQYYAALEKQNKNK